MVTAAVLSFLLVCGISYDHFLKVMSPSHSVEWQEKNKEKREQLYHQYNAQPLSLVTQDGLLISALEVERDNSEVVFVVCHGYKMSKEHTARLLSMFPNCSFILLDHRAHGQSTGKISSSGYYEMFDAIAAVDYIQQHQSFRTQKVVGLGISMGSLALARAVSQGMYLDGLILDSTIVNIEDHIKQHFFYWTGLPFMPIGLLLQQAMKYVYEVDYAQLDLYYLLHQATIPLLFIHSQADALSSYQSVIALQQRLFTSDILIVEGSKHAKLLYEHADAYAEKITQCFFS